eukprot:CAMPEP_0201510694 /NCGR_PEP_ID=MMETSP0161_2-20130828/3278_1 /ASSEMBLY_ACC=CAM_ASM_000251 /TAXON_ID=180227 /ORGANISM="Neoparamoeba aestuarina, Strain SoJaBio B1-5/56/2" /LENGTH=63 /DNA_ID=CAMNT_0047905901 /DNA_START=80 /DNA_END=271 /DNA_ORIENTATION=+
MTRLDISNNGFHGETDFSQLPQSLGELNLSKTRLVGVIDASQYLIQNLRVGDWVKVIGKSPKE